MKGRGEMAEIKGLKDYREFVRELEKSEDLVRVKKEVDWDLEIGAITRRACELQAPAPLFENIKDYPGWRILGNPMATWRRTAVAVGLPAETSPRDLFEYVGSRIENPIKPEIVEKGPCQENVLEGEKVDLSLLPAPYIHAGDAGRYIATWHCTIIKDPGTGWVNYGMYRNMLWSERYMGILLLPGQDIGIIFAREYYPKRKPMPIAIVIGGPPACQMFAAMSVGVRVPEVDLAGAILGEPVKLVKCRTVDLEVPADAEVVIEGEIVPDFFAMEGPFGEYTGFRSSPMSPRPVIRVKAITWRNDPIFCVSNMGMPLIETTVWCMGYAIRIKKGLEREGIPVRAVNVEPWSAAHMVIVSTETPRPRIPHQIANIIWGLSGPGLIQLYVVVVDADVDPFNLGEVIHAIANQCHPRRDIHVFEGPSHPLVPYSDFAERKAGVATKVLIDATFPVEWIGVVEKPPKVKFSNPIMYPPELQKKVLESWREYGFPG